MRNILRGIAGGVGMMMDPTRRVLVVDDDKDVRDILFSVLQTRGIHADSATKLVTMLLYTNRRHECARARLRLLRSPTDLDDYAAEVPAEESTLVIFRNGPNA